MNTAKSEQLNFLMIRLHLNGRMNWQKRRFGKLNGVLHVLA